MASGDTLDIAYKDNVYLGQMAPSGAGWGLSRVAHERWGREFHAYRRNPSGQILLYVVSGKGWFRIGREVVELGQGMVFTFGPGEDHEFWCDARRPLEVLIVGATGRRAPRVVRESLGASSVAVRPSNPNRVADVMTRILETAKEARPFAYEICRAMTEVLLLTVRAGLVGGDSPASSRVAAYQECRAYLDRHAERLRSAAAAADACGISREHMCRLFREYGGTTPQTYLLRLRVNVAAHLLVSTAESVKEIAARLNFPDQYAFSKTFKKLTGRAPRYYRERVGVSSR